MVSMVTHEDAAEEKRVEIQVLVSLNDYAEQLGYSRELDVVYDYGNYEDILNIIEDIIKVSIKESPKDAVAVQRIFDKHLRNTMEELLNEVSATHIIDDAVNEMVGIIVDDNVNLKNECIRRD